MGDKSDEPLFNVRIFEDRLEKNVNQSFNSNFGNLLPLSEVCCVVFPGY